MNSFNSLISLLVFVCFLGCQKTSEKNITSPEKQEPISETTFLGEKILMIEYGKNKIPRTISPLDAGFLKDGYAFVYNQTGEIERIAHWVKGDLEGETYLFNQGVLNAKQIFRSGHLVYSENYLNQVKVDNQLYPRLLESFFFEDKYYAKINFPENYKGNLEVMIMDFPAVIHPLGQQTFQLVINDALDLSRYTLKLSYHPAEQDSLLRADYLYTQVIFAD